MDTAKKIFGIVFTTLAVVAAVVLGVLVLDRLNIRPRTDDAYLSADIIHITPEVSGKIVELKVRDNQVVKRGQVLLVIDQTSYALKVAQSQAQVRGSEAGLKQAATSVASQTSKAEASASSVLSAEAELAQATSTLARVQPLLAQGYVSAQQVDQARTSQRTAQISLQAAQQQARGAQEDIRTTESQEAQLAESKAGLAMAENNLRSTVIYAPCDGRVTGLEFAAGEYASPGKALFTIVNTERWYAVANFRETELAEFTPGQHVTVFALGQPRRPFGGHIESIGFGVTPDGGSTVNGLPAVPRSLNWVRISQRFPIRVLIDDPPEDLMRHGASAVVVVER